MPTLHPYLNFAGNTEEVFNFYKSVFGGGFAMVQRFRDMPDAGNMPADVQDKIMHISLPIGNNMLMATDATESTGVKLVEGNNHFICISPDSGEEATRLFNGLSEGGKITMPLQPMFWGALYGDFTDKYGIKWMVSYNLKKNN